MLSTYSLTVMMLLAKQFLLPPCSPAAAGWVGTPETRPGWPARVRGACELSRWWGAHSINNNRLSWRRGSVPARLARWASSFSLAFTAGYASLLARRGRRRRASGTSERGRRRHAPAGRGGRLSWRRRISRVRSARPPSSGEFVNAKSLLAARRGLRCRGRREGEPVAALAPPARVCGPSSACWVARGSPQLAQCVAAPGAVDSLIQGSVSAVLSVRERRVAPPGGLRADTSLAARWCDGGGAAGRQQRANHRQQQMQQPAVCLPSTRGGEISRGAKADGVQSVQQAAAGLAEAQVGGAMLQGCAVLANRLFKQMAAGGRHLPPSSPPPQLAPLSPQRVACPPPSRSPSHRGRLPTLSGTRSCMRSGATPYDRPCNLRLLCRPSHELGWGGCGPGVECGAATT